MHALLLLLYILPFIHPSIFIFLNYKKGCTLLTAASDKVYQLPAHGRWFSPGTAASSTTKTGRHDIAEILLKVALKHQKSKSFFFIDIQMFIYIFTIKYFYKIVF